MFKKFDEKEAITGHQQLKSSVQKGIRNKLIEDYPHLESYINEILPKKDNFKLIKCREHIELLAGTNGEVLFFKTRDTNFVPTLKMLHQFPFILTKQQVDKGAIRFILSGANVMCPGLTSPGAKMSPGVEKDTVVAIMCEGKQHAIAIGMMKMSTEEVQTINKGIGIELLHYLNDGLWHMQPVK